MSKQNRRFPQLGATNRNDFGQLLRENSYIVYIIKYTHDSSAQSNGNWTVTLAETCPLI